MARNLHTRREFLAIFSGGTAALLGCGLTTLAPGTVRIHGSARLQARPAPPTTSTTPGTWPLTTDPLDGALLVPPGYSAAVGMPLVVAFHGAGGTPTQALNLLASQAAARGFLLLAIGSRGVTWDAIGGEFGRDVLFIDEALRWTFDRCAVDRRRIAVQGFSDGASYALALALANGDLFTHDISFSPGFIPESESPAVGKPAFFISHGRQDAVLNIDRASRAIVPVLRDRGYSTTYQEFDGGHAAPAEVRTAAVEWLLG